MSYWERRHKKYEGSFKSVGHIGMNEAQNLADYQAKEAKLTEVLSWVLTGAAPPLSLWDAGAGTGYYINAYKRLGFSPVHVSDLSATAIELIRKAYPEVVTQVGVLQSATWDRKFHVVTCLDVLYHVLGDEEWTGSVQSMARHLLPGGHLVIQEHFEDSSSRPNDHIRFRTEADYNRILGGQWVARNQYRLPESKVMLDLMVYQIQ